MLNKLPQLWKALNFGMIGETSQEHNKINSCSLSLVKPSERNQLERSEINYDTEFKLVRNPHEMGL